jgi:hypothetical protein
MMGPMSASRAVPTRLLVFVPDDDDLARWIEDELAFEPVPMRLVRSIEDVVRALTEDSSQAPEALVGDFSAVDAGEEQRLRSIREHGWSGTVIAIGNISPGLREALRVDTVLDATLASADLRTALAPFGVTRPRRTGRLILQRLAEIAHSPRARR